MKKTKKWIAALLSIVMITELSGFTINNADVAVDTEENRVYEYITVDEIDQSFASDSRAAADVYDGGCYLISGTVNSVSADGLSFMIIGSNRYEGVECSLQKGSSFKYGKGDEVAVYGKVSVDLFDNERHIAVDKVGAVPTGKKSSEMYYNIKGEAFDRSAALKRTLAGGRAEYYIPAKWKEIEVNIRDKEIGNIEGYQYVLNKTPGAKSTEPESLFVCYIDKSLLRNADDINDLSRVEKAIVKNIDGNVDILPAKEKKTYYGSKYVYYQGLYNDAMEAGKGYRTEYVFSEDKGHGVVLFLYVYRETAHLSDVMFAARFLKVTGSK